MANETENLSVEELQKRVASLEERNRKLVQLATIGLVDLDADARIIEANPVFLGKLNISREKALGQNFYAFVETSARDRIARCLALNARDGQGSDPLFLCPFIRCGSGRSPTENSDSSVIRLIVHHEIDRTTATGTVRRLEIADLGASMLSGRRLLENDYEYQEMISKLPIPVFRRDAENRFTFGNRAYGKHVGMPFLNKTDADLFDKELASKYAEDDAKVLGEGLTIQTMEMHRAPAEPEPYAVFVIKTPVFSADGRIVGLQGAFWTVQDVAAQLHDQFFAEQSKALQKDLLEKEARYHSLLEMVPAYIFIKDVNSRFTYVNQAFASLVGQKARDIIGKSDEDLFPADLAEKYVRDDQMVIKSGNKIRVVERHKSLTKGNMDVEVVKEPLFDSNRKIWAIASIFWDITVIQSQMFEDLFKFIAHDIKNFVTVIEANLTKIEITGVPNLTAVENSLTMLKEVISKTSRFGILKPHSPGPLDLDTVIQQISRVVNDPRIQFDSMPDRVIVIADKGDIQSAVLELVANSLQAIADRTDGSVLVSIARDDESGSIEINDNGPGYREPAKTERGLGLAFVKYVTNRCFGTFSIQQGKTGGTVARISVPLKTPR